MDTIPDIATPDPATVLAISRYFAPMRYLRLDHIYVKRGVTYAVTVATGDDLAPPDATIWRYAIESRDHYTVGYAPEARETIHLEEVGRIDGMAGCEVWYDEEAEHDVPGLRAE